MKHLHTLLTVVFVLGCLSAAHANTPPAAPANTRTNLLKDACSIALDNPSFSWTMVDADNNETQSAYRIVFSRRLSDAAAGDYFLDTGWLVSSNSAAVNVGGLSGQIEPNSLYYWQVAVKDKAGAESPLSEPQPFTTEVQWANTNGIWLEATTNEKANFVFLRHTFAIDDLAQVEKAIVAATACNTESSKQYVFDLYLNGQSAGVGPARNQNNSPQGNLQYYNSYDVTAFLKSGDNALAAIAYNRDAARSFLLQMTLFYTDGSSAILVNSARDAAQWKGRDGTLAFGQEDELVSPSEWYRQHKEHIYATQYPFGFAEDAFVEDAAWRAVKVTGAAAGSRILTSYASENSRRFLMPANKVVQLANGNYVVTLEKEIVGSLQLDINSPAQTRIELRCGEDLNADGSVRSNGRGHPNYIEYWTLKPGEQTIRSLNMKNFRYVEVINSPVAITTDNIKGYAVRQDFDEAAADFQSSNPFLNELYAFMKYTIRATNQDVWTDSNARERGPYEGDAIINMASSNVFSANYTIGRHSHEYLLNNPTWPQEYKLFSVEMAWLDYLYTGDRRSLDKYYSKLKNKFPGTYNAALGLVNLRTDVLIDWPEGERDNYAFGSYNTGYNAIYVGACRAMANIAERLGNESDRAFYQSRADAVKEAMIDRLYNPQKGAFEDSMNDGGALSGHYSQHATAYALAYGIFDSREMAEKLAAYIESRGGFKTSIYAAFFVLRGLYEAGSDSVAMQFMANENADDVRTWAHALYRLNATITPEAWDPANKPNMTFSHPWGSAPASAIAQGMFGIQPIDPSFETFRIRIQPGGVQSASIKMPAIRGAIEAAYNLNSGVNGITATVAIPANTGARVSLPVVGAAYTKLVVDGDAQPADREGKFLTVTLGSGVHTLAVSGEAAPCIEVAASVSNDGVLRPGKTGQITVTAVDERNEPVNWNEAAVTYSSADEAVVTVSAAGIVSAVGVGRTTVTVGVRQGDREGTASVPVRVTDTPLPGDDKIQTVELRLETPVAGATLRPSTVGIFGDGSELVFDNVSYTSANEEIARVNADGTVTFLAEGAFTLRAATTNGHFEKLDPEFDFSRFEITPFYTADFNDGANPFTGVTTNIAARDGRLFVGKSSNAVYAGGTEWTDYILLATVDPMPGTGSVISPGGPAATFHFRANAERTQLYMWQIFSGNYLKKHINISESGAVISVIDGMNPAGQDNRIAIAAEGNRIMTYANGKLVDVAEYANYSKGTVGVRTGSNEEFYLDDLVVGVRRLVTTLTAVARPKPTGIPTANAPEVRIFVEKGTIHAAFEGAAPVKLYSASGLLLDETTANGTYSRIARQGIYILSVAGKAHKIRVKN
jgi:hypothetical protein